MNNYLHQIHRRNRRLAMVKRHVFETLKIRFNSKYYKIASLNSNLFPPFHFIMEITLFIYWKTGKPTLVKHFSNTFSAKHFLFLNIASNYVREEIWIDHYSFEALAWVIERNKRALKSSETSKFLLVEHHWQRSDFKENTKKYVFLFVTIFRWILNIICLFFIWSRNLFC